LAIERKKTEKGGIPPFGRLKEGRKQAASLQSATTKWGKNSTCGREKGGGKGESEKRTITSFVVRTIKKEEPEEGKGRGLPCCCLRQTNQKKRKREKAS